MFWLFTMKRRNSGMEDIDLDISFLEVNLGRMVHWNGGEARYCYEEEAVLQIHTKEMPWEVEGIMGDLYHGCVNCWSWNDASTVSMSNVAVGHGWPCSISWNGGRFIFIFIVLLQCEVWTWPVESTAFVLEHDFHWERLSLSLYLLAWTRDAYTVL